MKNRKQPESIMPEPSPGIAARETDEQVLLRLEWTVLRRLDGLLQGDYRTLLRGFGLDFAGLREYQFEDDVRHIDWNVTARMSSPYVRQFSEDRDMNAWFLVDLSPSSDFGSARESKRDVTVRFVATMARLLSRHGNRAGAMLYGSTVDAVIPPGSDRRHVLHLLHRMRHRPVLGAVGPTRLAMLLQRAAATLKRRSAVFIVSDFISEPGWEVPLAHLAQRHDVVAVHMTDPAEQTVPDLGLVTMEDPETGEQFFVDTGDAAFRERYAALAIEHAANVQRICARYGAGFMQLATNQSLLDNLVRFAQARRRQPQIRQTARAAA
jgi:uncharacterized protein (DUF58 family)